MSLPNKAKFMEEIAYGVSLYDVSHLLPTKGSYATRPVSMIERIYVHHSGRLGAEGFQGVYNSARYVVQSRGWPGIPYHYWIPCHAIRDSEDRLVIFKLNSASIRGYHTGGEANTHGISIVLQGNTTARPLSYSHEEGLEAILPWLANKLNCYGKLDKEEWLSWHSDSARFGGSGKQACPGKHAEEFLKEYRRGI